MQGAMKPRLDLLRGSNRNLFYKPKAWKPAWLCLLAGIIITLAAVSGYQYAGSSGFCTLCHSMEHVRAQWQLSRHKQFDCIECHMPAGNIVEKVKYKTRTGINDLVHETLRNYPAYIMLSSQGRNIINGNCLRCHFSTVENTMMVGSAQECSKCHRNLVHGKNLQRGGIKIE
jgi:cytochrome c nitrite reductase small subunit